MLPRTFVVTVSDSPNRVVVEDVRSRRRAVGEDLLEVGPQIAGLLKAGSEQGEPAAEAPPPPVSEP